MNGVFATPPAPPHLNQSFGSKMSLNPPLPSNSRKRKADDDFDTRMSASPSTSPSLATQPLPRQIKKPKSGVAGRPLSLSRLLETLDADSLRTVLRSVCDAHPDLAPEISRMAPRPSVPSALEVLRKYQNVLQNSFPFGGDSASDYAFNRVRQHLQNLLDALSDFVPHFLPPHESQVTTSLNFLDGATNVVHELPDWRSFQNNLAKQNAYDELSRAWILVVQEASKRAAGIYLKYDGWDRKLAKHNQQAGGRLQSAVDELHTVLGWAGSSTSSPHPETASVREQLLSGTYGANVPVRVGPW